MKYIELQKIDLETIGLEEITFEEFNGHLVIDGMIALPLRAVSCALKRGEDIDIILPTKGKIGNLCLCRECGKMNALAFTAAQKVAFITDLDKEEFGRSNEYQFKKDYFVIHKEFLVEYKTYEDSSPLWGDFIHDSSVVSDVDYYRNSVSIEAVPNLKYPTIYHKDLSERAIYSAHNYDRFLKLYHHLELLFDWTVVEEIKKLGNDLENIGKIMSKYSAGDFPRLKDLINTYCDNCSGIEKELIKLASYPSQANTIFDDFGKEGNPLKSEKWLKFMQLVSGGDLTLAGMKKVNLAQDTITHEKLLKEISAYFIYRIRCCIAHQRIGEYLLKKSDEAFVVEFGENLLKTIMMQVMSSPKMPHQA